jgi:tight adherence protein B
MNGIESLLSTPTIAAAAAAFVMILVTAWIGFSLIGRADRGLRLEQLRRSTSDWSPTQRPAQRIFLEDGERSRSYVARLKPLVWLRNRLEGAGMDWTVETFFTNIAISAGLGVLLAYALPIGGARIFSMVLYALLASTAPWIVVQYKNGARMKLLEEQLPEALDFIARAIRAGHAFSVSLEMLANEGPDPIRTEFRKVHTQVNLGGALEPALRSLVDRVPIVDVRFFVSAVLLQRETGGNLSEMLTNVGNTVRERMKLRGQVRAATAHGRMTALVLTTIPIVVAIFTASGSPDSFRIFIEHPTGRLLGIWAIVSQILGYIVIRKIIDIKI